MSFWEINLAQRCFTRWRTYKNKVLGVVVKQWAASILRESFK